ncbi:DUF6691 family protein [Fluviibacter phosphoraccumulans]|jgi:uncharacterized membrane protein YedE/YeeE|uniref:Membrane protein n=1 Tax=Fluviibacter phosphoraccumulans TaxID=1751046 RepID=A0A679IBW1_9RHOO|nr:DUF6691 family protein [Fluviibacter phosphoraccumulans]BBU67748.1 membrane protein [Fluviibacter phosphoraccumulans]BBU70713.1 membrane protein [Fluviibacter phosphoraccumulans]BCA65932.1 membrane protein [Fluviibacter phosphoraccumulans]
MNRGWQWITAGLAGLLLGLGLILSGMANPAKVVGFLDVAGPWDPSLGLVMGGGLVAGSIGFALLKKQPTTLLGEPLNLPTSRKIDLRLIMGSVLFGIGWGITGICPGPGLVLLGAGIPEGVIYIASLLVGMTLYSVIEKLRHNP